MPAAGLAPDEFSGTDGEPVRRAFLVDELALEDIGLLDLDVLMIGQRRAGSEFHQRGNETGRLVEQEAFDFATGKPGLLPFHVRRTTTCECISAVSCFDFGVTASMAASYYYRSILASS